MDPPIESVREAARRRHPLGGADVQALEGALTQAEAALVAANATLRQVQGMCGNPDSSTACRIIVKFINEQLAQQAEKGGE